MPGVLLHVMAGSTMFIIGRYYFKSYFDGDNKTRERLLLAVVCLSFSLLPDFFLGIYYMTHILPYEILLSYHYFAQLMGKIGFSLYSQIIWDKQHTSRNSAFGSWMSPSCPSFITTFEYVLIFYKESRRLLDKYHATTRTDLTKDEFVKYARAMWSFPGAKSEVHPAPFPLELPKRCIKMLSYIGDQILDPYCGRGTTCKEAKELDRDYIGFDVDPTYVKYAKKWVGEEE